jgi:hypothetical protein
LLDGGGTVWTTRPQQLLQDGLDPGLALPSGPVQDAQVLFGGTLRLLFEQTVIDQPKATRGEQVVAVTIVGECSRLAYQPVNDMPVVDAMFASSTQSRQAFHKVLGVPDLDVIGVQTCLDPFADQAAGHRVGVAADVDGAATIDTHRDAFAGVQALGRQRPQQG